MLRNSGTPACGLWKHLFQSVSSRCSRWTQPRQMSSESSEATKQEPVFPAKHTIFSGIQPTGKLHLGNYFGAVKLWLDLQNGNFKHKIGGLKSESGAQQLSSDTTIPVIDKIILSIVDLHGMTLPYVPQEFKQNIRSMMIWLLACGLDPDKVILFRQSDVSQHAELSWILGCFTSMARLERIPTYKEKSAAQHLKWTPLGLYVYPVLQASDILLYRSTLVPVGEDQLQNIQLVQEIADRFNDKIGANVLLRPRVLRASNPLAQRIRSLRDPTKKMSKSDPTPRATITITDPPDTVVDKCKRALTDMTSAITYDPVERPGVSNLIAIHSLVSGKSIDQIVLESASLDTAKYKLQLAEELNEFLKPIQLEIAHLEANMDYVDRVYRIGAERARDIAMETMASVREAAGLKL